MYWVDVVYYYVKWWGSISEYTAKFIYSSKIMNQYNEFKDVKNRID